MSAVFIAYCLHSSHDVLLVKRSNCELTRCAPWLIRDSCLIHSSYGATVWTGVGCQSKSPFGVQCLLSGSAAMSTANCVYSSRIRNQLPPEQLTKSAGLAWALLPPLGLTGCPLIMSFNVHLGKLQIQKNLQIKNLVLLFKCFMLALHTSMMFFLLLIGASCRLPRLPRRSPRRRRRHIRHRRRRHRTRARCDGRLHSHEGKSCCNFFVVLLDSICFQIQIDFQSVNSTNDVCDREHDEG